MRLDPDDHDRVVVRFFDTQGPDISEDAQRKIERLFQREDHRRAMPNEIGDIQFPARALEEYAVALEATVDPGAISAHRFKLVIDYSFGAVSGVMPEPPAEFSPLAITQSSWWRERNSGTSLRTARRPGSPTMSPMNRMRTGRSYRRGAQ